MLFDDWKAARRYIRGRFKEAKLPALADVMYEVASEEEFLRFCKGFEDVAREINAIDWKCSEVPETQLTQKGNSNV